MHEAAIAHGDCWPLLTYLILSISLHNPDIIPITPLPLQEITTACRELMEQGGDDPTSPEGQRIIDLVRTSNEVGGSDSGWQHGDGAASSSSRRLAVLSSGWQWPVVQVFGCAAMVDISW